MALLRYFDDATAFDILIPAGAAAGRRGAPPPHGDAGDGDRDVLLVPYEGRYLALPAHTLPVLARHRMYGLRLLSSRPADAPARR
jgi:hypothetical protein